MQSIKGLPLRNQKLLSFLSPEKQTDGQTTSITMIDNRKNQCHTGPYFINVKRSMFYRFKMAGRDICDAQRFYKLTQGKSAGGSKRIAVVQNGFIRKRGIFLL